MSTTPADPTKLEELVDRSIAGDARAQRRLVETLWPIWTELVRKNRSMGSLAQSKDHVEDVVGKLVEKFCRPDRRTLKSYLAWHDAHGDKTFADWNRIVTKNAIRDYLREQMGTTRRAEGETTPKRLLNELARSSTAEELGVRPPFTSGQTARELLDFAREHLSSEQMKALRLWLEDAEFEEIGRDLGIDAADARKVVKAGIAVLRRHFGTEA